MPRHFILLKSKKATMEKTIVKKIDALIEQHKKDHTEKPLYLIISKSEGDQLMEEIRESRELPEDHIITNYKGIRIERSVAIHDGKFFLTNELPETGA
jgi:hypothetical protein